MKHLACSVWAATALLAPLLASAQPAAPASAPAATPTAPAVGPTVVPLPPSRWTPAQIRQSFETADSDGNGQLTRAEAQNLAIMPRSFEEADQNKDGAVTRSEYEALFLR